MKCKGCGREFVPVKNNGCKGGEKGPRLYCSPECRNRAGQAKYRAAHKAENLQRQSAYYQVNRAERISYEMKRKSLLKESNKEKIQAGSRLHYAVRTGKIIKPLKCENCNTIPKRLEAHHYKGYDHPLEVKWLCTSCHKLIEKDKNPC